MSRYESYSQDCEFVPELRMDLSEPDINYSDFSDAQHWRTPSPPITEAQEIPVWDPSYELDTDGRAPTLSSPTPSDAVEIISSESEDLVPSAKSKKRKVSAKRKPDPTKVGGIIYEEMMPTETARRMTITMKGFETDGNAEQLFGAMIATEFPEWFLDVHMALHQPDKVCDNVHIHVGVAFNAPRKLGTVLNVLFKDTDIRPRKVWAANMRAQVKAHAAYCERGAVEFANVRVSGRQDNVKREELNYVKAAQEYLDSEERWSSWLISKASENSRYIAEEAYILKAVKHLEENVAEAKLVRKIMHPNYMYQWQRELKEELMGETDDRKIIVYVDETGNCGKTSFGLSMMTEFPQRATMMQNGKTTDLVHVLTKENRNKLKIIFYDLVRSNDAHINFDVIERMKNGYMVSTKYDSATLRLSDPPHFVMFSNAHFDYSKMSADRWDIRELVVKPSPTGRKITAVQLSTADAQQKYKDAHPPPGDRAEGWQ